MLASIATSISNLTLIRQLVRNWQPFFQIQDGAVRHLGFQLLGTVDVIDVILAQIATFPLNLTLLFEIVKKWQQFFKIQYGSIRHLGFQYLGTLDVIYVVSVLVSYTQYVKRMMELRN